MEELSISINNIWVLVAAFLVMFMQPGFAMVEAGFTRSKNSANILTKNLVDFSLGAILYWAIGYTLMYGESLGGFIGKPILFLNDNGIGDYANTTDLFFQTVFAATAATIVSGAVAERTKFSAYIIFTVVITVFIQVLPGTHQWFSVNYFLFRFVG